MDAAEKASQLRYALRGQILTECEERVLAWAAGSWDPEAVEVITTWIETAREAAFLDGLGRRRPSPAEPADEPRPFDAGDIIEGASGPGW